MTCRCFGNEDEQMFSHVNNLASDWAWNVERLKQTRDALCTIAEQMSKVDKRGAQALEVAIAVAGPKIDRLADEDVTFDEIAQRFVDEEDDAEAHAPDRVLA